MEKVINRLWVGSDEDVAKAKDRGYSRLCACKDGPDGHRAMLGYTSLGAPQDSKYLFATKGNWAAMNVVDNDDPDMIATSMIIDAIKWAKKEYATGKTILFHCNHGHERGPVMAMMFMRAIGELPHGFSQSKKVMKSLYPPLDLEGRGMMFKAHELWRVLPDLFRK